MTQPSFRPHDCEPGDCFNGRVPIVDSGKVTTEPCDDCLTGRTVGMIVRFRAQVGAGIAAMQAEREQARAEVAAAELVPEPSRGWWSEPGWWWVNTG